MQDGIQDGSQNIKYEFDVFLRLYSPCNSSFLWPLHNNIRGIHLHIISVQSKFGHNRFSAKTLDVFVNFAQ